MTDKLSTLLADIKQKATAAENISDRNIFRRAEIYNKHVDRMDPATTLALVELLECAMDAMGTGWQVSAFDRDAHGILARLEKK